MGSEMINTNRAERNYGIDLLRVVAMFMVCILHVLGHGGILSTVDGTNYQVAWFIEISAYCAVNCYALISGYVGIKSKFKISNIAYLWLQVVFYCLLTTVVFAVFKGGIGKKKLLFSLLPVYRNQYWYFTAYFGLFFLMPFLNIGINSLNKNTMFVCLIVLLSLTCLYAVLMVDRFYLNEGYSLLWLALLYLTGGYIGKYKPFDKVKTYKLILTVIFCIILTWLTKFIFESIQTDNIIFQKLYEHKDSLISYVSPTIFIIAISLLELFSRIKFNKKPKLIAFFAPVSFGVYLIHEQKLIRDNYIMDGFVSYATLNPILMVFAVLGTALGIYLVSSLIDYLRLLLFNVLKVKPTLEKLENKIKNKIFKEESNV